MILFSNISNTSFPSNPNFHYYDYQQIASSTYLNNIVTILDFVKGLFSSYFNNVDDKPLSIYNKNPNIDYAPKTVYETNSIYLDVSENYWCQYIYQFSHEFCHYMNWGHVTQSMRWFEETLCELASHFFLLKSYEKWETTPSLSNFKHYFNSIFKYKEDLKRNASYFNIAKLFNPESEILRSLEKNEYQRGYNKYVAIKLLPYFIKSPSLWKIVPFLPSLSDNNSFEENLILLSKKSEQPILEIMKKISKFKE